MRVENGYSSSGLGWHGQGAWGWDGFLLILLMLMLTDVERALICSEIQPKHAQTRKKSEAFRPNLWNNSPVSFALSLFFVCHVSPLFSGALSSVTVPDCLKTEGSLMSLITRFVNVEHDAPTAPGLQAVAKRRKIS